MAADREIINRLIIMTIILFFRAVFTIFRYYTKHIIQNNSLKLHNNLVS